MDNRGQALAWVIAAVALVLCGVTLVWGLQGQERAAKLEQQLADAQAQAQELSQKSVEQVETAAALEAQVKALEDKVAALKPAEEAESQSGLGDMLSKLAKKAGASSLETPEPGAQVDMSKFMDMYKGEQGRKLASASASMAIDMHFKELFDQLNLPPEIEQKVRQILIDQMTEQIQKGADMWGEEADAATMKEFENTSNATTREKLAELLSNEGLAIYDEYQATMPERVLRKTYDMQLNIFASGMTPENRELARDVLVEEMLASKDARSAFGPSQSTEAIKSQLNAMDRAHERLAQVMEPDQLSQFDRFAEQQRTAIEAFMNMMKSSNATSAPEAPTTPEAPEAPAAPEASAASAAE